MGFTKATKSQLKARIALVGSSGSGKTFTMLRLGKVLAQGGRMAVIDTEKRSASKYANGFDFDVLNLDTYSPETYVKAINEAAAAGYSVLGIDSLSHAWMGKEGALEQVDKAAARSRSGNTFTAWRDVTPMHNALIDAMLQAPMHIIVTMRAKTEYVMEKNEKTGKNEPKKIGMAPIQRDGMEYEFDIVGDMDQDNRLIVSKSRCPELSRAVVVQPGEEFAESVLKWLNDGTPAPAAPTPSATPTTAEPAKPASPKVEFANLVKAWTEIDGKSPDFKQACADILKRACGKAVAPNAATDDEFLTAVAWVRLHQSENFATVLSANGEAVTA